VKLVGIGTEQPVLDCELAIQKASKKMVGELFKTGAGQRIGSRGGKYAVDVTVFEKVIPLIRNGNLGVQQQS